MFVSYAQNGEDVVLARALDDRPHGCYVDIGAAHPTDHSVTKHFYDRGWTGINVEPHPDFFALLERHRPRDVNVQAGIADHDGDATFYACTAGHPGGSTFAADIADDLRRSGLQVTAVPVPLLTMTTLLERHLTSPTIDFLKIDVEGYELEVLSGLDLDRWRPTVIVAEARHPISLATTRTWEDLLFGAGYALALDDGINRFYAQADDEKHLELLHAPANFLDDWRSFEQLEREAQLEMAAWAARDELAVTLDRVRLLELELAERDDRLRALVDAALVTTSDDVERLRRELEEIKNTRWWRLGRLPRRLRGLLG